MLITFPYGTKNQAVRQTRPMWTWVTSPPKQQTFLLPNTEPQSPGPGIPRADLSHSINSALVNWYPLNHGNSIGAFDIGPHGFYLQRNTVEGLRTDGPRGQCTAYKSRRTGTTYTTTGRSSFERTEDASELQLFSTTSDNWTISCWARVVTGTAFTMFSEVRTDGARYATFRLYNQKVQISVGRDGGGGYVAGGTAVGTGWAHCVGVKIGTSGDVYLDGEIDTATVSGILRDTTLSGTQQVIKRAAIVDAWPPSYEGDFCNLRVWRRALDQSEIRELYRNPWVGLAGSPVIIGTQEAGAAAGRNLTLLGVG